jgi:hypothetical protein
MIDLAEALLSFCLSLPSSAKGQNGTPLGIIVLIVIESPVIVLLLAALLGRPRRMRVTQLFLGWLLLIFLVFIGAVFALSYITHLFY